MAYCIKIHGISPACYRLIQSSSCLILPHERNLIAIKNTLGIEGEYSKVFREITSNFDNRERHVILQMDEVHIRSDAYYKGGIIIGFIDNPRDPPTTVFAMMISSLINKFQLLYVWFLWDPFQLRELYPIVKNQG